MRDILKRLKSEYGSQVSTRWSWVLNEAAGFYQPVMVLHLSITEYLIFTGTPQPTSGGNGPYPADLYDFMIDGELRTYAPADFARQGYMAYKSHKPGQVRGTDAPAFSCGWQLALCFFTFFMLPSS